MNNIFNTLINGIKWPDEDIVVERRISNLGCKLGIIHLDYQWLGCPRYRLILKNKTSELVFESNTNKDATVFKFMRYLGAI